MSNHNAPLMPNSSSDDSNLEVAYHVDETVTHIPRILIVEDTEELAEVLAVTLQRMHFLTFHESHGMKALDTYKEVRPDLVLLDIGLPDMTGWKVLDAIKESKAILKRPGIIVMTAYGDPANRLMGKLQGVDEYLIKPFTPDEIERVVRQVLQG